MQVSAVTAAILTVDESVLDVDKLVSLRGVAPSDEELTVLKAYTGDVTALGEIEQARVTVKPVQIERYLCNRDSQVSDHSALLYLNF
jgi:hypothetical protein